MNRKVVATNDEPMSFVLHPDLCVPLIFICAFSKPGMRAEFTAKNTPSFPVHDEIRRWKEALTPAAKRLRLSSMRLAVFCLVASATLPSFCRAEAPIFKVTPETSSIKFFVKASVAIDGTFSKWDASLTFSSPELADGSLKIKIYADSVNTGSGMKNDKLKSKDFFNAEGDPYITFDSTGITQTGANTFDVPGKFTIRGVSKPETLQLTVSGIGTGQGDIKGTMAFDRKEYGMTSGIPFIKIADRVQVDVAIHVERVSGPPVALKKF
jgi:polyisoprenoid-binding protein YceI